MTKKDFVARGSAWIQRAPEDGKDAVSYEILLDTDSVVLKSDTKQFETHKLGDVHFMYHQGSYIEDMTMRIIDTFSYIILYYGYEAKKDENGKPVLGSDGKPVMEYKAITYSSNEGITDIWNTMQMNVGDDAECYGMKYIWYDKNLPDSDEAMFEKIWSKLDGVPPTELGIKILATKMFTVRREADSIQSSDVVFGIGTKTQQPTAWITNFGGLTLADGKYVWTCTKTTLTNGTSYYTGAYCLGECYDFAQVDELYALGSSATKSPDIDSSLGVNIWQSSYTPKKGMYLWTCVRVTYNSNNIPYYLNKKCVSYFPTDGTNGTNGTSFNLLGTAAGHMKTWVKPSPFLWNTIYLVDGVNGGYPMTYKITTEGTKSAKANVGDAYIIDGNLWVANTTEWVNVGNIQGAPGEPGQDGEDALNIELSTDKILFSWDRKNKSYDVATKDITLIVKQGNNIINIDDYTINFQAVENFELGSNNKNIRTDEASDGYTYNISFYSAGIAMQEYTFNASVNGKEQKVSYPASSCSVKILITYNGITYTKIIGIEVSFVQMYGDLAWNTEQLSSTFGKLTAGYDGTLAQMESNISQNAENIALKVSQTYYDENNKKVSERFTAIKQNVNSISIKVSATSDGLAATGINLTDGSITMTANKFKLYNNNKEEVFSADENGNGVFKGKVTATSGYIGGCEIYNDSYEIEGTSFNHKGLRYQIDADGYMPQHVVNMRDRGFYVGYGDSAMGGYFRVGKTDVMVVSSGGKKELSYGYFFEVSMTTTASVTGQSAYAAKLNAASNASGKATALEANAYGGKENYAVDAINGDIRVQNGDFRAENGAFVGVHRSNVQTIYNSDYYLKKTDSIIICNNTTKDIFIYLPSDAVVGTFYRIIKKGKTVTLQSSNKNIGVVNNIDLKFSVSSGTAREWINCLFDGDCWNVEMSRS